LPAKGRELLHQKGKQLNGEKKGVEGTVIARAKRYLDLIRTTIGK